MRCAFVFLAIALQAAFACEGGYGGGWGYGGYGYPSWGYGGLGGYGLHGYGCSGYTEGCGCPCGVSRGLGYGGGYGGCGCGCIKPCEEIVIKEKPGEIRKVVVEEEFLVPVRKQSRPRPLEVVVDAPCDCCPRPCHRPCHTHCHTQCHTQCHGGCGGYY